MATAGSVLRDGSTLSSIDQAMLKLERLFAFLSGLAIFSLMLLAVVSVGGRQLFNSPLPGYVDWIEQAMPLIAIFGVSYVQREGGHIRMDIVIGQLRGRALWLSEFITTAAAFLLTLALIWGSYSHFVRSFSFAMPMWSNDSSIDIALPLWPGKLLVPIAFALLLLRLGLQLVVYARAMGSGEERPVGVPLIEDAATLAAREADSVSGAEQK